MHREQKGHVIQGIDQLLPAQRPLAPIRKRMGLVEFHTLDALDQVGIGGLRAVADHGGGDLRIEKRLRQTSGMVRKQFQVLPSRMQHFFNAGIADKLPESGHWRGLLHGREVDDRRHPFRCDLDQLQAGDEMLLPHKLGIDGNDRTVEELITEGIECIVGGNERLFRFQCGHGLLSGAIFRPA